MQINTERLIIRPVTQHDWRSIQAIWKDYQTSEYACYDRPNAVDDETVRTRIARWADANASGTAHMFFAVCLRDVLIGYTAFNLRKDGYEIGYCFHSGYHGKRYAQESHRALIAYFRGLGITRFTAGTALSNTPSVALLRSLGFRQVGTEKVSFYQDDAGHDIIFDGGIFALDTQRTLSNAP